VGVAAVPGAGAFSGVRQILLSRRPAVLACTSVPMARRVSVPLVDQGRRVSVAPGDKAGAWLSHGVHAISQRSRCLWLSRCLSSPGGRLLLLLSSSRQLPAAA